MVTFGARRDKLFMHQEDILFFPCLCMNFNDNRTFRLDVFYFLETIVRVANLILKRGIKIVSNIPLIFISY